MSLISTSRYIKVDQSFAKDVQAGLSEDPKRLSSKYFYDKKGDELFQSIMRMPEYYLTSCEYSIFTEQKDEILQAIGREPFELIELGAGDGYKTKVLLSYFQQQGLPFVYRPVDISQNVMDSLQVDLEEQLPELSVRPLVGDYFKMLEKLHSEDGQRKVVLFLGSNIGNYNRQEALRFLEQLRKQLEPGDHLLIGFDLKKDPEIILQAYNDPAGITAAFNLNLLERINRELGGNFNLEAFSHWETYNPVTGAAQSYLVSQAEQEVEIKAVGQAFHFQAWEAINVELSLKYSPMEIEALARAAGFQLVRHFYDDRHYFMDSLWEVH